eukprot:gene10948-17061_t
MWQDHKDPGVAKLHDPWSHQVKCLKWCQSMEAYDLDSPYMKHWRNTTEAPRMGIMGLPHRSGKTAVMASLVLNTEECNAEEHGLNPFDTVKIPSSEILYARVSRMLKEDMRVWGNVTFIITRANLVSHWSDTLRDVGVSEDRILSVPSNKICTEKLVEAIPRAAAVIFAPDAYIRLLKLLASSNTHRCVRRLIIDEADSLTVRGGAVIPNLFTWLVTGTHTAATHTFPMFIRHLVVRSDRKRYVVSVPVDMDLYPPVEFTNLNKFMKAMNTVERLNIGTLLDIQTSLPSDSIQLDKLMLNAHLSHGSCELTCRKYCFVSLREIESCSRTVCMPCCRRVADAGFLAKFFELSFESRRREGKVGIPVCRGCDALLPLDFADQLPDAASDAEFQDNFNRMRSMRSTLDVLRRTLEDAERPSDQVRIIVFSDTRMGEEMTSLMDACVSEFGYATQLIGSYLTQRKRLVKFGNEKKILVMDTGVVQGLNIPQFQALGLHGAEAT